MGWVRAQRGLWPVRLQHRAHGYLKFSAEGYPLLPKHRLRGRFFSGGWGVSTAGCSHLQDGKKAYAFLPGRQAWGFTAEKEFASIGGFGGSRGLRKVKGAGCVQLGGMGGWEGWWLLNFLHCTPEAEEPGWMVGSLCAS